MTGAGTTFSFEDLAPTHKYYDGDYNDIIFRVHGATATAPLLDELTQKPWQDTQQGQTLIDVVTQNTEVVTYSDRFFNPDEDFRLIGRADAPELVDNIEVWMRDRHSGDWTQIETITAFDELGRFKSGDGTELDAGNYEVKTVTQYKSGLSETSETQDFTVLSLGDGMELSPRVKAALRRAVIWEDYSEAELNRANEWIISLQSGQDADTLAQSLGLTNLGAASGIPNSYRWHIPQGLDRDDLMQALRDAKGIQYAYPLIPLELEFHTPDFVADGSQWHLSPTNASNVQQAWQLSRGENTTIGIVDDGFVYDHVDLAGNYNPALSQSFVGEVDGNELPDPDPYFKPIQFTFEPGQTGSTDEEIEAMQVGESQRFFLPVQLTGQIKGLNLNLEIEHDGLNNLELALVRPAGSKHAQEKRHVIDKSLIQNGVYSQTLTEFDHDWAGGAWFLEVEKLGTDDESGYLWDFSLTVETYNPHGTQVAGVAAADGNNGEYGSGVAPSADWAGLSVNLPVQTEDTLNTVLKHERGAIEVYNNSWGANFYGSSQNLASQEFLFQDIEQGRDGKGNIYVFSAGNSGETGGNVNYNAYANSRHTIAVGAVDVSGQAASYSTPGSSVLVSAFSGLKTTGFHPTDNTYHVEPFHGTSAVAPFVSGVTALMLGVNPDLTWRDVQHILVDTAQQINPGDSGWAENGAGYDVHYQYGFGLVDAFAAVDAAQPHNWQAPTYANSFSASALFGDDRLPGIPGRIDDPRWDKTKLFGADRIIADNDTTRYAFGEKLDAGKVANVEVKLELDHSRTSDLTVKLVNQTSNKEVLLFSSKDFQQPVGQDPSYKLTFSDYAERSLDSGNLYFGGAYQPEQRLSEVFDGSQRDGDWELVVQDNQVGEQGELKAWHLSVATEAEKTVLVPDSQEMTLDWVEIEVIGWHEKAGDLSLILEHTYTDEQGKTVTTESVLSQPHQHPYEEKRQNWFYTSARHWGEPSHGTWTLKVADELAGNSGKLTGWDLHFHGVDPDAPTTVATLQVLDGTASEDGNAGRIAVQLDRASGQDTVVNYTVSGGEDAAPLTGSVVIPAGALVATFGIAALHDYAAETGESVVITLAGGTDYSLGLSDQIEGTVVIEESAESFRYGSFVYEFGDKQYLLSTLDGWHGAQSQAEALGGNLVTIDNQAENDWLVQTFADSFYWIGLTDSQFYGASEGNYQWVTGEEANFLNWYPGEPNNLLYTSEGEDFGEINTSHGQWNDSQDDSLLSHKYGIIEIDPTQLDKPIVNVMVTDAEAGEDGNAGQIVLTRVGDISQALRVEYAVGGSASNGADYSELSGFVTFAPGQLVATVGITPLADFEDEAVENVALTLKDTGAYALGLHREGQVSIEPVHPVTQIAREVIGRDLSLFEDWKARFDAGESIESLRRSIIDAAKDEQSNSQFEAKVNGAYQQARGRDATAEELADWKRQVIEDGKTLSDVSQSLLEVVVPIDTLNPVYQNPVTGSFYFLTTTDTWLGAQEQAEAAGGNLVTINDATENQWLVDTFSIQTNRYWIGFNDSPIYGNTEGDFSWVSGESGSFTNWHPDGEPNNVTGTWPEGEDFTHTAHDAGNYPDAAYWNDLGLSSTLFGVRKLTGIVEILGTPNAATFLTPDQPYLSFDDSPFKTQTFSTFHLETFEDGLLNTPGISISSGGIINPGNNPAVDSVDADDSAVDGLGLQGSSWYAPGARELTVSFDAQELGGLTTHAGLAMTDISLLGSTGQLIGDVQFEAFDANGQSLGTKIIKNFGDNDASGGTNEDRFLGVQYDQGISSIKITLPDGNPGLEIDHIQYGIAGEEPQPLSTEKDIRINTHTPGHQGGEPGGSGADITALTDGGFVVVWESENQGGSGYGIYGQRYNTEGVPVGREFSISTTQQGDQSAPAVTALPNGEFLVVWSSPDSFQNGIYGQRFNSDGSKNGGDFQINVTESQMQTSADVTLLTDGSYLVTWTSYEQLGREQNNIKLDEEIVGRRFTTDGQPPSDEFVINQTISWDQEAPDITPLKDGGFIATWHSDSDGSGGYRIMAQRFNASNQPEGPEIQVPLPAQGNQATPSVAELENGGFVITWRGEDAHQFGTFAQRYTADGQQEGEPFLVNTETFGGQNDAMVVSLEDGGFLIAWASGFGGYQHFGIRAQRYAADGGKVGEEFVISEPDSYQRWPKLTRLNNGNVIATWQGFKAVNGEATPSSEIFGRIVEIDPVNVAPRLSAATLGDVTQYQAKTISYADLLAASAATDANGDEISFRIEGVGDGLLELNGNSVTIGQTLVGPGDELKWIPKSSGDGVLGFTVSATDGLAFSSGKVDVNFDVVENLTPIKVNDKFQVNNYLPDDQEHSSITSLSDGGFVVTWTSENQDGNEGGIYARRYNAQGVSQGQEFQINSTTLKDEYDVAVVEMDDGNLFFTWTSSEYLEFFLEYNRDIYGRIYGQDNEAISSEFKVSEYIGNSFFFNPQDHTDSSLIKLSTGEVLVTWRRSSSGDIYARKYTSQGISAGEQYPIDFSGGNSAGNGSGGLSTISGIGQEYSLIATNDEGFVMVWQGSGENGEAAPDVYARKYDTDGQPLGDVFRVNTYQDAHQWYPEVSSLQNGGFVITWTSSLGQDGDDRGIYGQIFDAQGNRVGQEFQANTYSQGNQTYSQVVGLDDNGFIIVWESENQDGIYGQRFDSIGVKLGDEFEIDSSAEVVRNVNSDLYLNSIASVGENDFVLSWASTDQNGNSVDVHAQRFTLPELPQGQATHYRPSTPYTNPTNSPFQTANLPTLHIEDFQDNLINSEALTIHNHTNADITNTAGIATDDPLLNNRNALQVNSTELTLDFSQSFTHVGLVITDINQDSTAIIEAFDSQGSSLGQSNTQTFKNQTDEFLGISNNKGIASVKITTNDDSWQVDHIQYG
ncbi:MAG: S8 family serine peptidase [Spirulina sp. SIO3F2]|nr:S8 family serine peptidase [Spirulina sp. SIO3F2]